VAAGKFPAGALPDAGGLFSPIANGWGNLDCSPVQSISNVLSDHTLIATNGDFVRVFRRVIFVKMAANVQDASETHQERGCRVKKICFEPFVHVNVAKNRWSNRSRTLALQRL